MISTLRFTALLCTLVAFTSISTAQLTISLDITVVNNTANSELEVYVRPDEDFDELFSSSVFTIRWDVASGAQLMFVNQQQPASSYHNVIKSGDETDDGLFRYQIFAGFGLTGISNTGQGTWMAGNEYLLMTIPYFNGTSNTFEIVNDTWTSANNGDYYVSLNGQNRTGLIYSIATDVANAVAPETTISVQPNPSQGEVAIQVELPATVDLGIELINAAGQTIWNDQIGNASGVYTKSLDLAGYSAGSYMFRVKAGAHESVHPLILE